MKVSIAASLAAGCVLLSACGGGGSDIALTTTMPTAPATPAAPYISARDVVQVTGGEIAAAADSSAGLRVFKAIPFAAPPVGALRWRVPQPVAAWTGVRRSDNFSAACVAGNRPAARPGSILYQTTEAQSEDCLYLNVWTGAPAASGEKRPVMMLVYGGGFQVGSASKPNYEGAGLAAKGAVVVTFNYRLGPLGFLAHPDLTAESGRNASGNYAAHDAIAALQWIQANIATFGGDPANVTVYSESAGAQIAGVLLASPRAAGLFHRMNLSSLGGMPAGTNATALAQAEAAGTTYATNLGATTLAAMRAKSAAEVMAAAGASISLIVDGDVLPDQVDLLFARRQFNDVPLLLGWNADEGTPYPAFATTLAGYETTANARYGAMAPQFKSAYPVASDADVLAMAYSPMRDGTFAWNPWTTARAHAARSSHRTWLYHFTRRPAYYAGQRFTEQDPPEKFGAYHSLEQVYFYNNLDRSAPARPYDATDRRISDISSSYLVNFARTGNPNGAGLPVWPAFTGPTSQAMEIGDSIAPIAVPNRAGLDFFDAFYTQNLGRPLPF